MRERHRMRVMVLVKAAPVLTADLNEAMCVAAVALDGEPRWVRLHPVPFRDLDASDRFAKYQELEVDVVAPTSDRRAESWTPVSDSISLGPRVSSGDGWAERRRRVAMLPERTMCELVLGQRVKNPVTPTLAVVRPAAAPRFRIETRDEDQLRKWRERAEGVGSQASLFADPDAKPPPPPEVVPWRFSYSYRCRDDACGGHKQTIVDWEAVALWRNVRHHPDWQDRMRAKFESEMWSEGRDTVLFVGNMAAKPQNYLVLGIFWPPAGGIQGSLLEP